MTKYKVLFPGGSSIEYADASILQNYQSLHPEAIGVETVVESDPVPFVEVPQEVSTWRVKAVCIQLGKKAAIDAAIDALPEPNKTVAYLAWNEGTTIERASQLVAGIAVAAGLSEAEIDQIFIEAYNLAV